MLSTQRSNTNQREWVLDLIDALEAHHLATPLPDALDVFLREPGSEAHARLMSAGFDQGPVRDRQGVASWGGF